MRRKAISSNKSEENITKNNVQCVITHMEKNGKNIYVRYMSKCIKYIFFQKIYI